MSDCGASILLTSAEYADEFDTAVPIVEVDDCATVGDSATSPRSTSIQATPRTSFTPRVPLASPGRRH